MPRNRARQAKQELRPLSDWWREKREPPNDVDDETALRFKEAWRQVTRIGRTYKGFARYDMARKHRRSLENATVDNIAEVLEVCDKFVRFCAKRPVKYVVC
jgi:hypothetical protein